MSNRGGSGRLSVRHFSQTKEDEMSIDWETLGCPQEPAEIRVSGIGIIEVSKEDIERAKRAGGNPTFELHDATALGDDFRRYVLGLMI